MHPPPFHDAHLLSDWPDCRIEARCPVCRNVAFIPIAMVHDQFGDASFRAVLAKLRCGRCKARPAPVYLLADQHREFCFGGPPGWAIELVPQAGVIPYPVFDSECAAPRRSSHATDALQISAPGVPKLTYLACDRHAMLKDR